MTTRVVIFHFCDNHGPSVIWSTSLIKYPASRLEDAQQKSCSGLEVEPCPSCHLFSSNVPFYLTKDAFRGMSVISETRRALEISEDFVNLSQVGLRLLSGEVLDSNHSIIFSDEGDESVVLGTLLTVNDPLARGSVRKFATALLLETTGSEQDLYGFINGCNETLIKDLRGIFNSDPRYLSYQSHNHTQSTPFSPEQSVTLESDLHSELCAFLAKVRTVGKSWNIFFDEPFQALQHTSLHHFFTKNMNPLDDVIGLVEALILGFKMTFVSTDKDLLVFLRSGFTSIHRLGNR